jgi:hypothetical protein
VKAGFAILPITPQVSDMRIAAVVCAGSILLAGCVTVPPDAFVVTQQQLAKRQIETRRYDGIKEEELLAAVSNLLQDTGFTLENSEAKLGLLSASKQRDATHGGEIVAAIFVAVLTGVVTPISKDQTIRASVVVRPVQSGSEGEIVKDSFFVRVTFQRIVRRTDNSTYVQTLDDVELYQDFFDKLSKAVFLEGQKI